MSAPVRRLKCWWFGCWVHPQNPAPIDCADCEDCGEIVSYGDLVGDTRHNRFINRCKVILWHFSWRKYFPAPCPHCGKNKCDPGSDCDIPF